MRCPYCQAPAHQRFSGRDYNRRISDDVFDVFQCDACRLMFIANPPADLGRYYPKDYNFTPQSAADLEPHLPSQQFKIDVLKRFVGKGELLEIGPSNGVFCRLAQKSGFAVSAIEMDEGCVAFLRDKLDVRVVASADPAEVLAKDTHTYDAICLWHAIEHLPRPWDVLASAIGRLKPNGILLIAAPNPDAWQARLLGGRWPHHDLPRHLFGLPIPWLRAFGDSHGAPVEFVTTRDEGSLYWNRFTWAMLLRSALGGRDFHALLWRAGLLAGKLLEPWEGREGRGSAYIAVLRRAGGDTSAKAG